MRRTFWTKNWFVNNTSIYSKLNFTKLGTLNRLKLCFEPILPEEYIGWFNVLNFNKYEKMKKITIPKDFTGKIFFTSDTHFKHGNIINYCKRPFLGTTDMDYTLVKNWNNVVSENDIVFHLGDFCFGDRKTWKKIREHLNGKIYLVLGNHDRENEIYYDGFESVDDIVQLSLYDEEIEGWATLILCHYCLTTWPGQWKGALHCFGHSHTNPNSITQLDNDIIGKRPLPSYDVGVDNNNFKPISYDDLKIIFTQQLLYGK